MVLTPVLQYDTSTVLEYTVLYCTVPAYVLVRRILFELRQYGTSTVQPYKYRQEMKGPKYSTVRYRSLVNVHKVPYMSEKRTVRYSQCSAATIDENRSTVRRSV